MEHVNLLTPGEAADLLRLTTHKVKQLASRGDIPTVRVPGDEFRFLEVDLWAWVETRKVSVARVSA